MKVVKLGVVGCGVIGRIHLEYAAKSPFIELVAVADLNEKCAAETAGEYGLKYYTEASDLVKDPDVEAIVLAIPTGPRAKIAFDAFSLGKHVLLEKPVAMNAEETKQLIQARGSLTAGCCSSRIRFLPSMDAAHSFLQTGALGKLRLIRSRNINPVPPFTRTKPVWAFSKKINGGGNLVNLGVYDLEYMFGLFDWSLRPEYVLAQAWNIPDRYQYQLEAECDGEIHVAAMIGCEGGVAFQLERGTLVSGQKQSAWEICGEHGTLYLDMSPSKNKKILFDEATEKGIVTRIIWEGSETKDMRDGGPVVDFASAILNGIQPKTSMEQALISQQVIDAIYASSESNQPVKIK